jgi:hypothetical protein
MGDTPQNPRIVRLSVIAANLLVMVWIGFSLYALTSGNGALFQRLGAVGVGAVITHYVFIRYTWRRRAEHVASMETTTYAGTLFAKAKMADEARADENVKSVAKIRTDFNSDEAKSVVVEALLLVIATLQSGFGDCAVNLLKCGAIQC